MERCAPGHIEPYCLVDLEDKVYRDLSSRYEDDYTFVYKIKCKCGQEKFEVFRDAHPTVRLKCMKCDRDIVAYDLDYYPVANKLSTTFDYEKVVMKSTDKLSVYVVYSYDDECEEACDVAFDQDDLTWCMIYCSTEEAMMQIVNDETS